VGCNTPVSFAILLTAVSAAPLGGLDAGFDASPYLSLVTDGGFALDAGERGQLIDSSNLDAGPNLTAAVAPRVKVTILGAVILPPEVSLDMLRLPSNGLLDEATAEGIRGQLSAQLLRTGFELATVTTRLTPDGIAAEIDEGKAF
jgi:hypothetical protein